MESVLIISDKGPFGTNTTNEAIRLGSGLMGLGEDVDVKIILTDDAVLFFKNNLNPEPLGMDSLEQGIEMADLTEIPILLIKEDMDARGMTEEDVVDYDEIYYINRAEIPSIIQDYGTVYKI